MPLARPRLLLVLTALAGAAVVLAGSAQGAARAPARIRAAGTVVELRMTALGRILVDARGRTLYLFASDRAHKSACYGGCAALWPPLVAHGKPRAGAGVKARLLGVTVRKNGSHQVTYAGHPLYLFSGDAKAGQTAGEGLKDAWWVVSAAGRKVAKAHVARTAGTTVALRKTRLGPVLVDAHGMTLYLYTRDAKGESSCYGSCASLWPPLLAHGGLVAGTGVRASLLGTTKRRGGARQVTYAGHPLYRFASDRKAGETGGEGVLGVWYAVAATGKKVAAAAKPTTTTSSGYGSSY